MKYKILDFHAHIFPEKIERKAVQNLINYYNLDIRNRALEPDLEKSLDDAGVSACVVHSTATNASQVENINTWIHEVSIKHPKLIGFGTIHPDYPDCRKEIKRIKDMGLKGIKLHPEFQGFNIDDESMFPIYDEIGSDLPVLFHMGDVKLDNSNPLRMLKILHKFPLLRVVGAHFGGYQQWDKSEKYLMDANMYMDTSSSLMFMPKEQAVRMIRKHGADKFMFGTDYPSVTHTDELKRFFELDLTDQERKMILWDNGAKLLGID